MIKKSVLNFIKNTNKKYKYASLYKPRMKILKKFL